MRVLLAVELFLVWTTSLTTTSHTLFCGQIPKPIQLFTKCHQDPQQQVQTSGSTMWSTPTQLILPITRQAKRWRSNGTVRTKHTIFITLTNQTILRTRRYPISKLTMLPTMYHTLPLPISHRTKTILLHTNFGIILVPTVTLAEISATLLCISRVE